MTSTRTITIGPLLTTFTPAPSCTDRIYDCNTASSCVIQSSVRCVSGRGVTFASECFADSINVLRYSNYVRVYTPGLVCPAGQTSACQLTRRVSGATLSTVGCCASGWTCGSTRLGVCSSLPKLGSGTSVLYTCAGATPSAFTVITNVFTEKRDGGTNTILEIYSGSSGIWRQTAPILDNQQVVLELDTARPNPFTASSSRPSSTSLLPTRSGPSSTSLLPTRTGPPPSPHPPLSRKSKIIIGVTVPLGVLFIALMVGCCVYCCKPAKRRSERDQAGGISDGGEAMQESSPSQTGNGVRMVHAPSAIPPFR